MRRPALAALWLLATALTSAVAFWAVMSAGSEVNARPSTIALAAPSPESSPSTTPISSDTLPPAVTTTSVPSPTTAIPVAEVEWNQATINSPGGSIIVSYRPFEVRLESIAPRAGFGYEIDDDGPDRVRVELSAEEQSHTLQAEWREDGFATEVDSSGQGSSDGDDD
jgi:hypothetical protein